MKTLKTSFLLILLTTLFFSCQKEYSFETPLTPAGTWEFTDSGKLYAGNIDSAYIQTTGTTKLLRLLGKSTDGTQNFLLQLYATDSFTVGAYKASLFETDFQYFTQAKTIYEADQFIGEFIVNITAIGSGNVTGIFSGAAQDSVGTIKTLTLGKFTARIDLSTNGTGVGSGPATGTLGTSAGVCTPSSSSGIFTQGVTLTSTNTVTVQVTVATLGTYMISTNTVNGVSFSGTGTFTTLGAQNVILTGTGTPVASGTQNYTVTFGTSTCNFPITFAAGTPPATGTLGGSPGSCTPVTPAGTYTQGVTLTSSNTIQVQVTVATVGAYTISTNTVNGVSFSASGNFTTTGVQTVTLTGTGTPTSSGSQSFIVTFGTSICNFSITFVAAVTDYFPTTTGSYWAYGNTTPADSFLVAATSATKTVGSTVYNVFTYDAIPATGSPSQLYYRKAGGDYFEYFNAEDYYGLDAGSTTPTNIEYTFLKEAANVGDTWVSPSVTGTINSGASSATIYMKMTLTAKATTATSGVVTSTDVMKVKYEYYASVSGSPAFVYVTEERWFARGIGMIYNSFDDGSGSGADIYKVGRYKVN